MRGATNVGREATCCGDDRENECAGNERFRFWNRDRAADECHVVDGQRVVEAKIVTLHPAQPECGTVLPRQAGDCSAQICGTPGGVAVDSASCRGVDRRREIETAAGCRPGAHRRERTTET